jgi:hypothetical protein
MRDPHIVPWSKLRPTTDASIYRFELLIFLEMNIWDLLARRYGAE